MSDRKNPRARVAAMNVDVDQECEAGRVAIRAGDYDAAVERFSRAATAKADSKDAIWGLAEAWHYKGKMKEARRWYARYVELAPGDPEATHMVASLGGAPVPDRADEAYVRMLFDNFAADFDRILVEELDYKAPKLLYREVRAALPKGARGLNVLDAGCGTGLAGVLFRPLARRLAGVDLSREMVKHARARGIYDSLQVGELTRTLAASRARYDLIVAADVLVYVGDLAPVFGAMAAALSPGGLVAFTVEVHGGDGFELMPSGRFAHAASYVRRAAENAGLEEISGRQAVLRKESGVPVTGYVGVYEKR